MIQRLAILFIVMTIVMLISGTISLLHLSGINYSNLMTFAQKTTNSNETTEERVSFLTDDKVLIAGTYYSPATSNKNTSAADAIILLHMLGRDRNDWNTFASTLSNITSGYAVLSIDLRGHGQSINQNGKVISFQSFTPDDFNKMVLDVKAAKQFLVTQRGINSNNIAIVGASIGANVALKYAVLDPSIKAVVLLSPGLDYKGVRTSDAISKFKNPIYIAASGKDSIAGSDPQTLCNMINCGDKLKVYQDSNSHGTDMFSDGSLNPPLGGLIISWLNASFGKNSSSV
jgi:alpha-beta hydrolase superfamily lysophospholipase